MERKVETRGGKVSLHVYIPHDLYCRLVRAATLKYMRGRGGISLAVEDAVRRWIEETEGTEQTEPRNSSSVEPKDISSMDLKDYGADKDASEVHESGGTTLQGGAEQSNVLKDDNILAVYREAVSYVEEQYGGKMPETVTAMYLIEGVEEALKKRGIKVDINRVFDIFHKSGWIEPFLKMKEPIDWSNAIMIRVKEKEPKKIPKELPL